MKNHWKYPGFEGGKHEGPHPLGGEHAGADSLYRYNLSQEKIFHSFDSFELESMHLLGSPSQ